MGEAFELRGTGGWEAGREGADNEPSERAEGDLHALLLSLGEGLEGAVRYYAGDARLDDEVKELGRRTRTVSQGKHNERGEHNEREWTVRAWAWHNLVKGLLSSVRNGVAVSSDPDNGHAHPREGGKGVGGAEGLVAAIVAGQAVGDGEANGAVQGDHHEVEGNKGEEEIDKVEREGEDARKEAEEDHREPLGHRRDHLKHAPVAVLQANEDMRFSNKMRVEIS
jgi:hypothetical protein